MTIKTYQPKISVILKKNVAFQNGVSQRYSNSRSEIDLTPFIGENGEVSTHKSVGSGGQTGLFTVILANQMDLKSQDSMYGLISPMDQIEIRMSGEPHKYTGKLPIIMRGFVTDIRINEAMGDDGKPARAVIISGQDFTKIFINLQIFLLRWQAVGKNFTTAYQWVQLVGTQKVAQSVTAFIQTAVDALLKPYLDDIFTQKNRSGKETANIFKTDLQEVGGNIMLQGIDPNNKSLWNLIASQAELPWNELFVEDREDSPYLVLRKKPYKDFTTGNYIFSGVKAAETEIDFVDVKQINSSRTDVNVANLFWVDMPNLYYLNPVTFRAYEAGKNDGTVFDQGHANNSHKLYGTRLMQTSSNLSSWGASTANLPEAELAAAKGELEDWSKIRRVQLRDLNKDNVLFVNGSMKIRGNENVKPGSYIKLKRGPLESEYYVQTVDHKFLPFRSYTTEINFIRGTGFKERAKLKPSPYYAEVGQGV
jgi:hypothetical protein